MELKDKVPPHNLEFEQATLGAILLDWDSFSEVSSMLKASDFYNPQNQLIYQALVSLSISGSTGDILTLVDELNKNGNLEKAGGMSYISSLTDKVPTSANIVYYANTVLDLSTKRNLIKMASEVKAESFDETKDSRQILEEAQSKIFKLTENNVTSTIFDLQQLVVKTIQIIDKRYKDKGSFSGIPSGLNQLDLLLSGFQNGEMTIIGARPSMGKTALALTMMEHIAVDKNIPCGFFSLEMSAEQICSRLLSQVARIPGGKIRSGMLRIEDFQKLNDAAGRCYNAPLYICDVPNMKLLDLRTQARKMVSDKGVKIIFIDYIGLITSETPAKQTWEQQSDISKSLKALARELNVPIIVLCQVARDAEGNEPTLANLRGSGSIEQDADVVMFIHGDRKKTAQEGEESIPVLDRKLVVAKQRNGPIGDVEVIFLSSYTKFENKSKNNDEQ